MIKVLKFGGASIKDSKRIENVFSIIDKYKNHKIIIVFSAIANITNLLEDLVDLYINKDAEVKSKLLEIKKIHFDILDNLFNENDDVYVKINNVFDEIDLILNTKVHKNFSFNYDQIVSKGELLSSIILSDYLNLKNNNNSLLDSRDFIKTDSKFQNAKIDWRLTKKKIKEKINNFPIVTQGFVGSDLSNNPTTIGREGSDFTAAIIANSLDVDEVIIWKDVNGVLNADPRYFENPLLLDNISFAEAIELAFYGAKVIHPKTIQPLQQKNIQLSVRSFINYENKGTIINNSEPKETIPLYIVKENQVLISISDNNLSFIVEEHLSWIFSVLSKHDVSLNLMQNSAVSFSICIDNIKHKIPSLIEELSNKFTVFYNEKVELFTIRHYNPQSIERVVKNKKILLQQKSRNTVQFIVT
tara:strand:+ start:657 stop:1901 length:1245 start_codon:yes stop_codon:yes gene_type:complete